MQKAIHWAGVLFLATLPLGIDGATNGLLAMLVLAALVSGHTTPWKDVLRHPGMWGSTAFLAFCGLSISWSSDAAEGLTQLTTKLGLVLIPMLTLRLRKGFHEGNQLNLAKAWVWGAAGTFLLSLGYAGLRTYQEGAPGFIPVGGVERVSFFTYETLTEPFMHPGYLATHLGLALLLVLETLRRGKPLFSRSVSLALLLWLFAGMVLVQGRINILALFLLLGCMALVEVVQRRKWIYLSALLIPAAGVMLFAALADESLKRRYFQVPRFDYDITAGPEGFNSATYRLAEWKGAAHAIAKHPFLGAGTGSNREALQTAYQEVEFHVGLERNYNAHNQYLEILIATGIMGLLLFSVWWWLSLKLTLRGNPFGLWPIAFLALCMATESMLERAWGVMIAGAVLGFLVYSFGSEEGVKNNRT